MLSKIALIFTAILGLVSALPSVDLVTGGKSNCKPFSGNFTINQYQLYPENSDFDFKSCLLYIRLVSDLDFGDLNRAKNKKNS